LLSRLLCSSSSNCGRRDVYDDVIVSLIILLCSGVL
jgi:hypothetical protein